MAALLLALVARSGRCAGAGGWREERVPLGAASRCSAADRARRGQSAREAATFCVGRLQFGQNAGGDCGDVGQDLVKLVSRASTIQVQEERQLKLADAACSRRRSCS